MQPLLLDYVESLLHCSLRRSGRLRASPTVGYAKSLAYTIQRSTPPQSDLPVPKCRQIRQLPQRWSQGGCAARVAKLATPTVGCAKPYVHTIQRRTLPQPHVRSAAPSEREPRVLRTGEWREAKSLPYSGAAMRRVPGIDDFPLISSAETHII